MIILGIHPGHSATACLMKDGKVIAAISEERLVRKKNAHGYPRRAIDECLKIAGVNPGEVNLVALSGKNMWVKESAQWIEEVQSGKGAAPLPFGEKPLHAIRRKAGAVIKYGYNIPLSWKYVAPVWRIILKILLSVVSRRNILGEPLRAWDPESQYACILGYASESERKRQIQQHIGIAPDNIKIIEHHEAHAYYAYFGSPFRGKKVLILTADGIGDHINATVSVADEKADINRISQSYTLNSIGRIYANVTRLLGMKPLEHEYKVMGLAPYAKEVDIARVYPIFEKTLFVDGLQFKERDNTRPFWIYPGSRLLNYRFDWIAGAVQKFTEDILAQWTKNAIAATGIGTVVFSGGVAMNVKANMVMSQLPEVENLFICPSGGDESTALGAAYAAMADYCCENNRSKDKISPLNDVYLGMEYTSGEIELAINEANLGEDFAVIRDEKNIPEFVAAELAAGRVVARLAGRMEFGARALGNRTIMANPSIPQVVPKINEQIKSRDFWMPFAPTILAESEPKYVINPKSLKAPFMTIGFNSTELAQQHLVAALHPYDFTLRPQIISEEENPGYYQIIASFQRKTGIGAILNTSFNLHGEPIVCSPADAIRTFRNSGLDTLVLENIIIKR